MHTPTEGTKLYKRNKILYIVTASKQAKSHFYY